MNKLASKYKHVIWDWNGTLLDDVSISVSVMNRLLDRRNMPVMTTDHYKTIFDFPVIEYYRRLGFDFSKEPFEKISVEFIHEYDSSCLYSHLHKYAEVALKVFNDSNISQCILSASHQDYLERFVSYFGINHYFVRLIGLDNIHAASKVDNGRKWVKSLQYNPEDILLIGDTTHDYEVAREIGCDCVLVSNGHQSMNKLTSCNCKVFDTLLDVISNIK